MSELRTDSRELAHRIMGGLDRMLVGIETLAVGNHTVLVDERNLTDKEVSAQLKLSRWTLQEYRNEGRISYYRLGDKILYRESDIEKMLQEIYWEAYMSINKGRGCVKMNNYKSSGKRLINRKICGLLSA